MADMAMHLVNNFADCFGGMGVFKSYSDIIDLVPEEKRTAEEIIEHIKERVNGTHNEPI